MKTYGIDCEITKYIDETAVNACEEPNEKTSMQSNIPAELKGDTIVNLSESSKQVQRAKKVIDSEPDIRLEKVRAIQEKIQKGTYKIDYHKIAENILGVFIDEIVADPGVRSDISLGPCVGLPC